VQLFERSVKNKKMAQAQLQTVLMRLESTLNAMERLASASQKWVSVSFPPSVPKFSVRHKETVTGLAFLRAFIALEMFLEQSFILYLMGLKPPVGPRPKRLVKPTTRQLAMLAVLGDRNYTDWYKWDQLKDRAKKYFVDGKPYTDALHGRKLLFEEMIILRNALSHSSEHSHEKFKQLVRSKLSGAYPPNLTVGGFLSMTTPGSSPPETFLDYYMDNLSLVAALIIPT
jgi:hypothetical protein